MKTIALWVSVVFMMYVVGLLIYPGDKVVSGSPMRTHDGRTGEDVCSMKSPIAIGSLPQVSSGENPTVEGAAVRPIGVGEWEIYLDEPRERAKLFLTSGDGSNNSEWRGVRFGVSVSLVSVDDRRTSGWVISAYANRTGELVDAPINFVVYVLDAPVPRVKRDHGCILMLPGDAGEAARLGARKHPRLLSGDLPADGCED